MFTFVIGPLRISNSPVFWLKISTPTISPVVKSDRPWILPKTVFVTAAITTAQNVFPDQQGQPTQADKPKKAAKQEDNSILFIVVIGAAVAFFIWKRKRGKS